jgi:Glucosidase II beta subunit-like protein
MQVMFVVLVALSRFITSDSAYRMLAVYGEPLEEEQESRRYQTQLLYPSAVEEYDYTILDPYHVHGSPYGGFSRASTSRLAQLPLILPTGSLAAPSTGSSENDFGVVYTHVRDFQGRLFACRVYLEDELTLESMEASMFEAPILRKPASEGEPKAENQDKNDAVAGPQDEQQQPRLSETVGAVDGIKSIDIAELAVKGAKLTRLLKQIQQQWNGLCGQLHTGWWSYEWCFMQEVTQFHIEISAAESGDSSRTGAAMQFSITDQTSLGKYTSRSIFAAEDDIQAHLPENQFMSPGQKEMARIVDEHQGGSICPETGEQRRSYVHLQCCSDKVMNTKKPGMLHRGGEPATETGVALVDISEPPDTVCVYNVTVCVAMLCEEPEAQSDSAASVSGKPAKNPNPFDKNSISGILHDALDVCINSATGGWWMYEFCHGKSIKQYHESTTSYRTESGAIFTAKHNEAEHVLGKYQGSIWDAVAMENEWQHVVNVTSDEVHGTIASISSESSPFAQQKEGAASLSKTMTYVEIEYSGGDVCDDETVTDSAVVGGGTSHQHQAPDDSGDSEGSSTGAGKRKNVVARSSSVRYFCGDQFALEVNEDRTCHYVVSVTVPALCHHALFNVPVAKRQIIKCLPVEETEFNLF